MCFGTHSLNVQIARINITIHSVKLYYSFVFLMDIFKEINGSVNDMKITREIIEKISNYNSKV
jgi:hypothetical protein